MRKLVIDLVISMESQAAILADGHPAKSWADRRGRPSPLLQFFEHGAAAFANTGIVFVFTYVD